MSIFVLAILVLDILVRYLPSLIYLTLGRSLYTNAGSYPLKNGIELWPGFYQSARPTVGQLRVKLVLNNLINDRTNLILWTGKIMINVDVCATTFYEPGPLPDTVVKILGRRSLDELCHGIAELELRKLERFLKNLKIRVVHRGDRRLKFRISRLTPSSAGRTTFMDQAGNEMTEADYFLRQYNKRLNYPFLPCVVVKRDIFLPMEVCEILPGQHYSKKLNRDQTAEMIKFTCQNPNVRANKIIQGLSLL